MKCCAKCTRWKSSSDFYTERRPGKSRDGMSCWCKDCCREQAREIARRRYIPKNTMRQLRDDAGRFRRAA